MAWRQTGDQPLSEPMITYIADTSLDLSELIPVDHLLWFLINATYV